MNNSYQGQHFHVEVSPDEEYDDEEMISLPSPPQSPSSISRTSFFDEEESIVELNTNEHPGEWIDMVHMANRRFRFAAASSNGRLYVFGGRTKGYRISGIEVWTPKMRSWIDTFPPMNKKRSGASAAVIGEDIFIAGGLEDSEKNPGNSVSFDKFNVRTGSFTPMPSMHTGRDRHNSVAVGKKIYVFAGYNRRTCEVFDVEEGKWAPMPKTKEERNLCAAVAVGNKIFCIGGIRLKGKADNKSDQYLNTMEVYDIAKGTWTLSDATMNNRRAGCCAVTDGSTITVIGGRDEKNDVLAIEEFDIKRNEWRPSSKYRSLEKGRSEFSAILIERDLIIIGGLRDNSLTKTGVLDSVQVSRNALNAPSYILEDIKKSNEQTNLKRTRRPTMKQAATKTRKAVKTHAKAHSTSADKQGANMPTQRKKPKTSTNKAVPIEHKVAKVFEGDEIHFGTATKTKLSNKYWKVVYDDGDREDFSNDELSEGIKLYDEVKGNKNSSSFKMNCPLFGEERFLSLEKAKESKKKKIEDCEEVLFGKVQDGSLYERLTDLEVKIGASRTSESFSNERFESIEEAIKSKIQRIEDYEKDVYGESKSGSLKERMKNLEQFF